MPQSSAIFGLKGTEITPDEAEFFLDVNPYGYILFARNCESPAQVKRLTDSLRELSGREQLPILIDQEGGRVARLRPPYWPSFPPARLFAEAYAQNPKKAIEACRLNAQLIAFELRKLGITVNCAPVADVPVSGAHDIIGDRAFGHTPEQIAQLARAQAQGLMEGGVVPVVKHIPGHGRARADSHLELPIVNTSLDQLRQTDFVPFAALADMPMAMTAHVLYSSLDSLHVATLSPTVISLIRHEIGFKGLLMSDDVSMKALGGDFTWRALSALTAGCDVVLHCNGDMTEMQEIADGVRPLQGEPLVRAVRAMELPQPETCDAKGVRLQMEALLADAIC